MEKGPPGFFLSTSKADDDDDEESVPADSDADAGAAWLARCLGGRAGGGGAALDEEAEEEEDAADECGERGVLMMLPELFAREGCTLLPAY